MTVARYRTWALVLPGDLAFGKWTTMARHGDAVDVIARCAPP